MSRGEGVYCPMCGRPFTAEQAPEARTHIARCTHPSNAGRMWRCDRCGDTMEARWEWGHQRICAITWPYLVAQGEILVSELEQFLREQAA